MAALIGACAWAEADVAAINRWRDAGSLVLQSEARRVSFSRDDGVVRVHEGNAGAYAEVMSVLPLGADDRRATDITDVKVLDAGGREARCEITFASRGGPIRAVFALDTRGALRVEPLEGLERVSVRADYAWAVLPSRHLDDNIYEPSAYPELTHLHVPAENLLVGLVAGGNRVAVLAWPSGDQSARIALAGDGDERSIAALEVALAGEPLTIGNLTAPGLWYRVELSADFEQTDVVLDWKPPFEAMWKTQLSELGVPTTFRGVIGRRKPWRPTVGFYVYPFFEEDEAIILRLHKKLALSGDALIYALEGTDETPYGFLTANLPAARQHEIAELQAVEHYYVLDEEAEEDGLIMNAHCAGRDQLKATTLTVGAQFRDVAFLDTHIADRGHECEFIATHHVQRCLDTMDALDGQLAGWLEDEADNPGVLQYLTDLRETLSAMSEEYRRRLKGETPQDIIDRVRGVQAKFKEVIREDAGVEGCAETLALINELNAIISLEEDQGRRFGAWGRKLFQQAAYDCVGEPGATVYARAVRSRLREHLRYRQYETPRTSGRPEGLLPEQ